MNTIGCDPEFFIKIDNKFSKASKLNIPNKNDYPNNSDFKVFKDNVLLEINMPPAVQESDFLKNLAESFLHAKKFGKIYAIASHIFDKKDFDSYEDYEIGCHEELCVYNLTTILENKEYGNNTLRAAGGHLHIGTKEDYFYKISLVRMLDLLCASTIIQLEKNDKTSLDRRKFYGKPGRFRFTNYGIEYRVLSNYWTRTPELTSFIFKLVRHSITLVNECYIERYWKVNKSKIKNMNFSINDKDPIKYHQCQFKFEDLNELFFLKNSNSLEKSIKKLMTQELKKEFEILESSINDEDVLRNWFSI